MTSELKEKSPDAELQRLPVQQPSFMPKPKTGVQRSFERLSKRSEMASNSRKRDAWTPYLKALYDVFLDMKQRKCAVRESKEIAEISDIQDADDWHPVRRMIAATSDVDDKKASDFTLCVRYAFLKGWKDFAKELKA